MSDEERARSELVEVCQRLYQKGWVANHDGNASIKLGPERIVATPTAVSKGDVRLEQLIVVDSAGKKLEGTRNPFSELSLHLKAYQNRSDVKAVLHAHPPTACGFAVAWLELTPCFMPEAVVSIGDRIPLVPFALPFGDEGAAPLDPYLELYDAFLLTNHGVLTIGPDLWTCYYRMELVEHLAKIQQVAIQLGQVNRLSDDHIATLLERRKKAGLGPEARRAAAAASASTWNPPSSTPLPSVPEGPAPSAWMGPPVRSLCADTTVSDGSSAGSAALSSMFGPDGKPSSDAIKALLEVELKRVLGK